MNVTDDFRALYERHHRDVYRFCLFLTGDASHAEDLASEAFVRAWTARDRIRQVTVRAYLLTIARHLYRDDRRSSKRLVPLEPHDVAATAPGPEVQVQHASRLRDAKARLRQVARGDRRALVLYVVKEMTYAEVATVLGISPASAKSRIFRAREALRAQSGRQGEVP